MMAMVFLITGLVFVVYPLSGAVVLTLFLGIFFLVIGICKLLLSFFWKMRPGWKWLFFAGVFSLFLGLLVIFGLPGTAVWAVGLMLGIDLILFGITLIALGVKMNSVIS